MSNLEAVKAIPMLDIASRLGLVVNTNNKALCFNGHDSAPSLSINTTQNYFKCFGCGVSGSNIDLVKEFYGIKTGEAIKWIESAFNVPGNTQTEKTYQKAAKLTHSTGKKPVHPYRGIQFSDLYKVVLETLSQDEAVQYLNSRGIEEQIARGANIRTLPKNYDILGKLHAVYSLKKLQQAGLVAIGRNKNPYFVFFAHRLIIPYFDNEGNIINLQGRNIDTDQQPKYKLLSGIETCLYNTQGLKRGDTVYLCEGAIDTLSCLQLGLKHPVGIPGVNNFKEQYYSVLDPYKIIIASDKDGAGKAFYTKVRKTYLARGKEVYALDYTRLIKDYNVNTEVKDMNDIAKKADHNFYEKKQPQRLYSAIVNDTYEQKNNRVFFDSGVIYNRSEIEKIKDISPGSLRVIHKIKQVFKGKII